MNIIPWILWSAICWPLGLFFMAMVAITFHLRLRRLNSIAANAFMIINEFDEGVADFLGFGDGDEDADEESST